MKNRLLLFALSFSLGANAQYYYKDISGTAETNQQMKLYRQQKVQLVSINSYDANNTKSDDFFCQQSVEQGNILKTTTRSGVTEASVLTSFFNEQSQLVKTIDSSGSMISTSDYGYDTYGKLITIKSVSKDSSQDGIESEDHLWTYDAAGKPLQMLRIINSADTLVVKLDKDENGNIVQETSYKKGKANNPVYYYYDDKNRLTDIVRYNEKLKKLIPDYMFEYSDAGQVVQKITVPSNRTAGYLIWRYQYDSHGLKTKEACFDKDKQLTGKIEYIYSFGQ
jgi:hypothetical protein